MIAAALGTVSSWLTLVVVLVGALVLWRGKAGEAVTILQDANEVLTKRVKELEQETRQQALLIAELQTKTDFATQLRPLLDGIKEHERNAARRTERLLDVMDLMAKRLGGDDE